MNKNKKPMTALLRLDPALNDLDGQGKELRDGLSAAVVVGDTLWVAGDETTRLERLSHAGDHVYEHHEAFALNSYLTLHAKEKKEADIEGLEAAGGYLWLVGSHSLKRGQPQPGASAERNRKHLAASSADGNRFLLARIPLVADGATHTLAKKTGAGKRRRVASQLRGDDAGNELTATFANDEHLGPFLAIPGKDNGLDIEGLCVARNRVFIGLRGPVLRGWATILELAVREDGGEPATLRLEARGPRGQPYRKHFLDLGGLGVRDLCVAGADLLILAGPTIDLDGPVSIFRWRDGTRRSRESIVFADDLEKVADVPYGIGVDHAEAMALLPPDGRGGLSVLLLHDTPSAARKKGRAGQALVRGDVIALGS